MFLLYAGLGAAKRADTGVLKGLVYSFYQFLAVDGSKFRSCSWFLTLLTSLQHDTLWGPLGSGVTKRLLVMSRSGVTRRCSSWRVDWRWRSTSCWGETSAILAVLVLVYRSISILESSKLELTRCFCSLAFCTFVTDHFVHSRKCIILLAWLIGFINLYLIAWDEIV